MDGSLFVMIRFDYTRSKKRLEIRMPTTMHGGMEDFIKRRTFRWQDRLEESRNANISNAAKTIMPSANANVRFPYPRGVSDTKSPDWRIGHKMCERLCTHPTLVMEFGWTQAKKDLQAKAEAYSESLSLVFFIFCLSNVGRFEA